MFPMARTASPASRRTPFCPGSSLCTGSVRTSLGTYWYHSHQYSEKQVEGGLLGALVIEPAGCTNTATGEADVVAVAHSYKGRGTINAVNGLTIGHR